MTQAGWRQVGLSYECGRVGMVVGGVDVEQSMVLWWFLRVLLMVVLH